MRLGRLAGALAALSAFGAVALATGTALWACAAFYPNWLLGSSDLVEAPSALFKDSLQGLEPTGAPAFPLNAAGDPAQQTVEMDLGDVQKAVDASGALPAVRQKILAAHAELRKALSLEKPPPDLAAPRGLPPELADYLEGAIAYRQGHSAAAVKAWSGSSPGPPPSARCARPGRRSCSVKRP